MSIYVNYSSSCCGIKELSGLAHIKTPQDALFKLGKILYPTYEENQQIVNKMFARAKANQVNPYETGYYGIQNVDRYDANVVYADPLQYSKFRFLIFSEAISSSYTEASTADGYAGYGRRFAAYILSANLGEIISTGRHINPNSGNQLKVWIWAVDHGAFQKWLQTNQPVKTKPNSSLLGGAPLWAESPQSNVTVSAGNAADPSTLLPANFWSIQGSAPGPNQQG